MLELTKWLTVSCLFLLGTLGAQAQPGIMTVELEQLQQAAIQHYPLLRKGGIIRQLGQTQQEQVGAAFRLQVLGGLQATYQSDVTQLPIKLPNINIEAPARDQYKAFTEFQQLLFDGGMNKQQRALVGSETALDEQRNLVDIYALRDRVLPLYMLVLLAEGRINQLKISEQDIVQGLSVVEAQIAHGTALRSNAAQLQAQRISLQQQIIEWQTQRAAAVEQLSLFTGLKLTLETQFKKPTLALTEAIDPRPEWRVFRLQDSNLLAREKLIALKNLPRLAAFAQVGFGRPALNLLKNSFEPYYIGGLKLSWNLQSGYLAKRERSQLQQQRKLVEVQRDIFQWQQDTRSIQLKNEKQKYKLLLESDQSLIALRDTIKTASLAQLKAQVITATDYLRDVHAAEQAQWQLLIHELQSIQIHYQILYHEGKQL